MKFIKILQSHRDIVPEDLRDFIYKNMAQEMINGLEYDDPQTIKRALKLFGIEYNIESKTSKDLKNPHAAPKPVLIESHEAEEMMDA